MSKKININIMGQLDRIFQKQFKKNFNRESNFPITSPLELGAYGTIEKGHFKMLGNIKKEFGINYETNYDEHPSNETFGSSRSVTQNIGAKGDVGSNGKKLLNSQVELVFHSDKLVYFIANDVRYNTISNLGEIGKQIIKLYKEGKWEKHYRLITYLMEAGATRAFVSELKKSSVMIQAKTDNSIVDITDLNGTIVLKAESSLQYIIDEPKLCHLGYSVAKIKDSIFSKPDVKALIEEGSLDDYPNILEEQPVEAVDYEELVV